MYIPVAGNQLYIGPSDIVPGELGLFSINHIEPNTYIGTYVGKHVDADPYKISCSAPHVQQRKDRFVMRRTHSEDPHRNNITLTQDAPTYKVGDDCLSFPGDDLKTFRWEQLVEIASEECNIFRARKLTVDHLIDEIVFSRRHYLSSYPFNRLEDREIHFSDARSVQTFSESAGIFIDSTDENGFIPRGDYDQLYPCFVNEPIPGMLANTYFEEQLSRGTIDLVTATNLVPGEELLVRYN
jgi:hypothetical protein